MGHTWRERVLDPVATVHLFVLQILHGNTACAHVPRLGNVRCSGEAYGQAHRRLPLAVWQRLVRAVTDRLLPIDRPVGAAGEERRAKPYDLMNQPRDVLRKRLLGKANAA